MSEQNTCARCEKDIADKQCAVVDGKKYHVPCFVCAGCNNTLAGQKFHKKQNDVWCEACNLEKFAPTCGGCQRKIAGKHLVVEEKRFHGDCFVCFDCTTPFNKEGYYKEEEKFLCKKCMANRKNRTCAACNNLIEDNEVFAMNNYYHSDCFKCSKCNLTLADHTFVNVEGNSFHTHCVNTTCVVCGLTCEGEFYDVENDNVCHPECIDKYDPATHKTPPVVKSNQQAEQGQQQQVQQTVQAPPPIQAVEQQPPQSQPPQSQPQPPQQQAPVEEVKEQPQSQVELSISVAPTEEKKTSDRPQNSKYQLKTMEQQDVNSLDPSLLDPNRPRFSFAELQRNPPPSGVPLNKKELYLHDDEFEKIFKMKINRFLALKEWKRIQLKKSNNLF